MKLLEVSGLSIYFGDLAAVRDVSFDLAPGETLGLVGESGCGKTLSALSLVGPLPANAQMRVRRMELVGRNLAAMGERELRKIRGKRIAQIFQDPMSALNPCFSVAFQLEEMLAVHFPQMNKAARRHRCLELLELVGLSPPEEHMKAFPHQLSGGMGQRVMIAMAIACRPQVLVADEPTTALDASLQGQVLDLLKRLQQNQRMGMILITHDLALAARYTDRISVMYAGEMVERGLARDILSRPRHPYTQGLLASLPGGVAPGEVLPAIGGFVAPLELRPHNACQFHSRCPWVQENCRVESPPWSVVGKSEQRCFYPPGGEA